MGLIERVEEDDILFDAKSFGKDEFHHWYRSSNNKIRLYGLPIELKNVRAKLCHYADATKITSKRDSECVLSIKKV